MCIEHVTESSSSSSISMSSCSHFLRSADTASWTVPFLTGKLPFLGLALSVCLVLHARLFVTAICVFCVSILVLCVFVSVLDSGEHNNKDVPVMSGLAVFLSCLLSKPGHPPDAPVVICQPLQLFPVVIVAVAFGGHVSRLRCTPLLVPSSRPGCVLGRLEDAAEMVALKCKGSSIALYCSPALLARIFTQPDSAYSQATEYATWPPP